MKLKDIGFGFCLIVFSLMPCSLSATKLNEDVAFKWFDDAKLGMFIHWGVYSIPARGEWVMKKESISREDYAKIAEKFQPPKSFSPEEWVLLAKRMGAKYAVLTTRHHDGYALWDTKTTEFNSMKMCGRDFVREFADACRKHSLRVGFYYSILDWQYRPRPDGTYDPKVWKAYLKTLHGALRELMSEYGRVDMLWYDGCSLPTGSDPEAIDKALGIGALNRMARELQSGIIINNRGLVGGDFLTPEQSLAAPARGVRWESCMTVNRSWGYTQNDTDWKSPEKLIRALLHCSRLGGNLLLNIGPKSDGSVPMECVKRIEALGEYIRRCPDSIYGAKRDDWTEAVHEAGPVTKANGFYYLHALNGDSRLDGVEAMERVADGIYRVKFRDDAKPANWLGGRHDLEVKPGSAPVLGEQNGAYDPQEGAVEPCQTPEVTVPAAGEWKVRLGYVNSEGFKDTAEFAVEATAAKTVSLSVEGAKGYYARKLIPRWRVVDPRRWQVAGVFPGDYVGTGDYESIVKANDRDMLALAKSATFVAIGAANEKSRDPRQRVSFSLSAPKRGFGYALAKTKIYAPADGTYYAAAGFEYWGDVYVNGERIERDKSKQKAEPQFVHYKPIAFPIKLNKGENDILIVNHGGSGAHFFTFYLNFPNLMEAKLDHGGFIFDFQKISDERFRIPLPGDAGNLVDPREWRGEEIGFHVLPSEVPGNAPVRRQIKKAMKWTQAGVDEHAVITDGELLKSIAGEKYIRNSSGAWANNVKLPHRLGGIARLSFRFKMRHTHAELGYAFVHYKSWDEKKKQYLTRRDVKAGYGSYDVWRLPNESATWSVFAKDITIPPGVDVAEIKLRIDGGGELSFKDVGLVFAGNGEHDVAMQLVPHGFLDGSFAISSGQMGIMIPAWKRISKRSFADSALEFRFTFPKGISYVASNCADTDTLRKVKCADGGEMVSFSPKKEFASKHKEFNSESRPMMLVRADLPPYASAAGSMQAFLKGKAISKATPIEYKITAPLAALRPKRYLSGIMTYKAVGLEFGDDLINEQVADFLSECGVRFIIHSSKTKTDTIEAWRRGGFDVIFSGSQIANGYYMGGNWRERPKSEVFVARKGTEHCSHVSYVARSSCPLAIIEESSFFKEKTVGEIMTQELKAADGMWPNWEPFMFVDRGCDCERCLAAYERYHRQTGKDLRSFRSKMHGEVVKTLDRYARKLSGGAGDYGFVPGISWRAACSSWRDSDPASEFRPEDFASTLKAVGLWGPYSYWAAESPYVYQKRGPLAHYIAIKDIREQFSRDFPVEKGRPMILGTTQGIQCYDWITEPEWLEMALGAYLMNGWEGTKAYFFPDGYDARYLQAYARAATLAARYENFVFDGARNDAAIEIEPVGEYASKCKYVTLFIPKYRNVSPLQHVAWDLNGARMVGVFNYWKKGEAFFTLKSKDLKPGDYTIVDEDGVLYAQSSSAISYTHEQLQSGVKLMVGSARMKVFEIRPAAERVRATALMTASRMDSIFEGCRRRLSLAAKEDAAYEAANAVEKVDLKGEL